MRIEDDTNARNGASVGAAMQRVGSIGATLLESQVRKQAAALGDSVAEIGNTLEEVALEFTERRGGTWLVPAFDYAATRVDAVATYLRESSTERLGEDYTGYASRSPVVVGAAAFVSGFALARILRVSLAPSTQA